VGIALERRKQGSQVRRTAALENRSYSGRGEASVVVVEMPVSHGKHYVALRRRARAGWLSPIYEGGACYGARRSGLGITLNFNFKLERHK
jgi:hypothetical protein